MAYVLGIDVGTTRVKAAVVNEEGDIVSSGSADGRVIFGPGERAEQDPEELWISVVRAVGEATKGIGTEIRGVSVSTQGGTLIVMDGDGVPVLPAITWMDRRARVEGEEMSLRYGLRYFYERCGWTPEGGSLPFSQIAWLRGHERSLFGRDIQFGFVDSFLIRRMTGRHVTDPSNAAITVLCNVRQRAWDGELLGMVGISEDRVPGIVPSGEAIGRVLPDVAEMFGISKEAFVYAGGHDQYCGALGAGVIEPGHVMLSTGTAWVLLTATEEPLFDLSSRFAPAPHVIEGRWGLLASIPTAGACMEWLIGQTLDTEERPKVFDVINELVREAPPGADGLVFLPHFSGSSWPAWKGNARGAFIGLTLVHGRRHLFRAVMEGLAFQVRWVLDAMRTTGAAPTALRMIGGGARSPIWPKIVADGTGVPVMVPEMTETASFGAALLAGLGMGLFEVDDMERMLDREARWIEPDSTKRDLYDEMFGVYQRAFGGLENAFDQLAGLQRRAIEPEEAN